MEKLQVAYTNNQGVRFALCLALLLGAVLLFLFSGGFPPWAWRFSASVLPQAPRLLATQGAGVLLPLFGLLLLSLSLLILWVVIVTLLSKLILAWWRDFYARPTFEQDLADAERLSQKMLVHERAADNYRRQAAAWHPDDSGYRGWSTPAAPPNAASSFPSASFGHPLPREMFMEPEQEELSSVGMLYRAAGAHEPGYARSPHAAGISSRPSSSARAQPASETSGPIPPFASQPTPQSPQALQAPPEVAQGALASRGQLRLVPRIEDPPAGQQDAEDARYDTIPEFELPIDLSGKSQALEEEHDAPDASSENAPEDVPEEPALRLNVGIGLDPGIARKDSPNEDNLFAIQGMRMCDGKPEPAGLFVVADGMGGHANGQEASHMAIKIISDIVIPPLMRNDSNDDSFRDLLKDGTHRANLAIYQRNRQQEDPVANMMGTTVTAALVVGTTAHIVNVGDSRTYLYRPSEGLRKVTRDHSVVARMVEDGTISQDEIYTHPRRNLIYRCLGDHASIDIDAFTETLQVGDILVLCSDGLWEMVRDADIARILSSSAPHAAQISSMLVQAALSRGGADNISVIVICVLQTQT